mgnify:CR=1 FL=1
MTTDVKDEIVEGFNTARYTEFDGSDLKIFSILRDMIQDETDARDLLDIACGDGLLGSLMLSWRYDVTGCDISEPALQIARDRGLKTVRVNLEHYSLPFEDRSFGVIIGSEIIEHIYDTDRFLREVFRVLKDDGVLLLKTPNVLSLGRRICYLLGRPVFLDTALRRNQPGHVRYFVRSTLDALLRDNGFRPVAHDAGFVNFLQSGRFQSRLLAKLFPNIGGGVIVLSRKYAAQATTRE